MVLSVIIVSKYSFHKSIELLMYLIYIINYIHQLINKFENRISLKEKNLKNESLFMIVNTENI